MIKIVDGTSTIREVNVYANKITMISEPADRIVLVQDISIMKRDIATFIGILQSCDDGLYYIGYYRLYGSSFDNYKDGRFRLLSLIDITATEDDALGILLDRYTIDKSNRFSNVTF